MPRQEFHYVRPERFVVGTVGAPGQRTFYLQARDGHRMTSVALEKTQVALLAEKLDELLDDVVRRTGGTAPVPAVQPAEVADLGPLEVPLEEEFRVAVLGLRWDDDAGLVEVDAASTAPDDEEPDDENEASPAVPDPDEGAVLRVLLTGAAARAFATRARAVVGAGRPPCPLCAQPLDPQGHICPRQNGFRRRG